MRPQEIFDKMNSEERIILYAIGALDKPLRSKVKLQKLLFLVSNVFEEINNLLHFEAHFLGPYSEVVENIALQLLTQGLINKDGDGYSLTSSGASVYSCLRPAPQLIDVMNDFKELVHDLNDNEVMTFIYSCYPEYTKESLKWEELKKNRKQVALSLFGKGKLSVGRAAQVAGMNEGDFFTLISEKRIRWQS